MEEMGAILAVALRALPLPGEAAVLLTWPLLAGATLAAHLPALRCQEGILYLRAADPAWRREMERLRPELLRGWATLLGPGRVREIRCLAGEDKA